MIVAKKTPLFETVFDVYTRRLLRRHFHAVHVRGEENILPDCTRLPVILYGNHNCWWDAILPYYLSRDVLRLDAYAMMDERQLRRYRFFRRIGVFSVNRDSPRQALEAVRYAASLLAKGGKALWMYPQGEMTPYTTSLAPFESGIVRIAQLAGGAMAHPFAVRYEFRREQRPEAFVSFGPGLAIGESDDVKAVLARLRCALQNLMQDQAEALAADETKDYHVALHGRNSVNSRFDAFARIFVQRP
ncbi:MAG: lysophospholipid acyltransferase family protein [Bacteroidota bacterium]|nr:lysophospholipid acyltransferase family protein [Bacteroidota bacterium]